MILISRLGLGSTADSHLKNREFLVASAMPVRKPVCPYPLLVQLGAAK